MSKPVIRDATMDDLAGYHACLGQIAAERKFIGFVEPPPIESSEKWMRSVLETGYPFLVVVQDGRVVGWCDVGGRDREGFRHTAELGMGLALQVRGLGLGSTLLERAIDRSRRLPIEKLELQVYASNHRARKLYERFGFEMEGVRVRARKLDDVYDDVILMAHFLTPANQKAFDPAAGIGRPKRPR